MSLLGLATWDTFLYSWDMEGPLDESNYLEYHATIHDMPTSQRPRERLRDSGAGALSDSELLAIILRTGTPKENALNLASRLLAHYGGLTGVAQASYGELNAIEGIGDAKTAQIKAALELGKRLSSAFPQDRPVIRSPQDVARLVMPDMSLLEQEHLRVVLLNTKNQVVGTPEVYRGNVNTAVVRASEVFRDAVRENCPAVIIVHNHPSGDPTPSPEDIAITQQLIQGGQLLNIDVLDHVVIGQQRHVSMKEQRLGFS